MRGQQQPLPVVVDELLLSVGHRRRAIDRLVAREDAAPQEVVGRLIDGELEIAEEEAVRDPLVEGRGQFVDGPHFDEALNLLPGHQAKLHRRDRAEQTVAADRELEQLGVFAAAARAAIAVASIRTNDSTSPMNGFIFRPRP